MVKVEGPGGGHTPTPEEIKAYKTDYQKSFKLFQDAFTEYNKPDVEFHKKEMLKDVMNRALQIMNEVAIVSVNEAKQAKETKLVKDFQSFISQPNNGNRETILKDIQDLERL